MSEQPITSISAANARIAALEAERDALRSRLAAAVDALKRLASGENFEHDDYKDDGYACTDSLSNEIGLMMEFAEKAAAAAEGRGEGTA